MDLIFKVPDICLIPNFSPQMKKQLKPTAMRLLECYCFKTVPEFGHRSTSMQEFNNKN